MSTVQPISEALLRPSSSHNILTLSTSSLVAFISLLRVLSLFILGPAKIIIKALLFTTALALAYSI
jgi:hypothetical protein